MDILKSRSRRENAREKIGWINKYFFWYLNDTFKTGYKRPLNKDDIFKVNQEFSASNLSAKLEKIWKKDLSKVQDRNKVSFSLSVAKLAVTMYGLSGFFLIISCSLKLMQTYFLRYLIESLSNKDSGNSGYLWATLLWLSMVGMWLCHHILYYLCDKCGAALKSAIISLIYKKVLKLSNGSLNGISTGHVVTLISSDAHKFQEVCKYIHYIWAGPMMFIAAVVILWLDFGPASLTGILVLTLSVAIQSYLGKYFASIRIKTVHNTDERVSTMNEVISSMQVTKMYCWEKSFAEKIHAIRKKESNCIIKASLVRSANYAMFSCSPHLVVLAVIGTFYATGGILTLPRIFHIVALMYNIRFEVIQLFPLMVQMILEIRVGGNRIKNLLLLEEITPTQNLHSEISASGNSSSAGPEVTFNDVSAAWDDSSEKTVFYNISFSCNAKNNLVMIVGSIGSGKSSILMTAMNELKVQSGNIKVIGSVAFTSQQPWIFSGTLRQNILFGKKYDKEWYMKVIKACSLKSDIQSFENGDMVLVGEKGVSLSGGQKARISLARAVYHDADIYLLDDPLSAVDAKVGRQIFEQCIQGLLKGKTVILVTHQIQYLKYATDIICLENRTASEGTLDDFMKKGIDLEAILNVGDEEEDHDHDKSNHHEDDHHLNIAPSHGLSLEGNLSSSMLSLHSLSSLQHVIPAYEEVEETKTSGGVGMKLYYNYIFKGLGWFTAIGLFIGMVVGQGCFTFADAYLADWIKTEEKARLGMNYTPAFYIEQHPKWNLYIFAGIVVFNAVMSVGRTMFFYVCLIRCSRYLHNKMFTAVVRAPVYFFDSNPIGQILNRFSRDTFLMDEELPWIFFDFVNLSLLTFSIIVLNCISIPYLLILFIPLFFVFLYLRNYYLATAREIKRLESTARSPLYTHLSATLTGHSSIRSFNMCEKVLEDFYECLDYQIEAWLMFLETCRWFGQRIDSLALIFNIFAVFAPVAAVKYTDIDPGIAGVGLTYTLVLCGMVQFCVRQSAEVDTLMVSTQRVYEYSNIEPEPDNGLSKDLPKEWPQQGSITAHNASFSYHDTLPYVLDRLNFTIKPKEKIGIVGRTGAGKSSILNMLFRLGINKGVIKIDDRDIDELQLKDLRKSLSVIPQDPVLFGGSLRKNLDPFSEFKDIDIWAALEGVQLKNLVAGYENKLETEIKESGSNLSVGERQLLCLARALLKRNKILVIDEATANVDFETDFLIQSTIREKFKECTVLTIAHRLNTIMDSDRIMVLDSGAIVEFDAPYNLLQIKSGILRKLVNQTGEVEASKLELQAKNSMNVQVYGGNIADLDLVTDGSNSKSDGGVADNLGNSVGDNIVITFNDGVGPDNETLHLLST